MSDGEKSKIGERGKVYCERGMDGRKTENIKGGRHCESLIDTFTTVFANQCRLLESRL